MPHNTFLRRTISHKRNLCILVLGVLLGLVLFKAGAASTNTVTTTVIQMNIPAAKSSKTNAVSLVTRSPDVEATPEDLRPFQLVLPKGRLLGDWFGLIPLLDTNGITPNVTFVSDVAGNPVGGKSQGVTHADNLGINLQFDLQKLVGLDGASFLASASERSGNSLSSQYVGNVFTIQQVYGGETFKIIDLAYKQKLFHDRVEFQAGRIAAGDDFLVSPYNWLFMQNGFCGNPVGIFFNAPGMSAYPNATWGTTLKVKPTPRTYVLAGVYNGDPTIRADDHHGMDLSMNGPIFLMAEAGYQRNGLQGDTGLIGNYRVGAWYDNSSYQDYQTVGFGTPTGSQRGNWGLYTLVDQVLIAFGDRSRNSGLGVTASALVSPNQNISQLPYFFTAGVVARGFLEARPYDLAGFGVLYGEFSDALREAQEREQVFDPTIAPQYNETVLELTYRFYFRQSSIFFQPDLQYIIKPGGTGNIDNALVLGFQIGFNF